MTDHIATDGTDLDLAARKMNESALAATAHLDRKRRVVLLRMIAEIHRRAAAAIDAEAGGPK